jgi:signal peptidase I
MELPNYFQGYLIVTSIQMQNRVYAVLLRALRYTYAILGGLLTAVLLIILLNTYAITIFQVDGMSMQPTLINHQLLVINLAAFQLHDPKVGDVVIVQYSGNRSVHFVKRVVGVPGDTVLFHQAPLVLQANQYFIEGDNRDHSTDSRVYGPVLGEDILGKEVMVLPIKIPIH